MRFVAFQPSELAMQSFWAKAQKGDDDECWMWKGNRNVDGYGMFYCMKAGLPKRMFRAQWRAHVFSRSAHEGRLYLRRSKYCCHTCDQPACVNPNHLYWGTPLQNMQDKAMRGRQGRGETGSYVKLNKAQVREIFRLFHQTEMNCADIARRFGVDQSNICLIGRRKTWASITADLPSDPSKLISRRHVRQPKMAGSNHPQTLLNEEKVKEILTLYHEMGVQLESIAHAYVVSQGTIRQIIDGRIWHHVCDQYCGPKRVARRKGKLASSSCVKKLILLRKTNGILSFKPDRHVK